MDLAAIMLELREKRMRGGDAPSSENGGETPPKKQEPRHETKPQPKPESKPEPVPEIKPDIPKPREGVDLAGIMRELREKRIREQKEKSDKTDDDGGDAEPDRGGIKSGLREAQLSFEAPDEITDMPEPRSSGPKKKTTIFLGKTYQTGLLGAILIYLLVVGLIQAVVISTLNAALQSSRLETDTAIFVSALLMIDLAILVYSVLRILPGLFERRFAPFSCYLDYLLFAGLLFAIVEVLILIFEVPNWLTITLKIIGGILAIVQGARVQERIFELPNTRGIARKAEFWGINTFGSPDKILFQEFLSLGYTPIVLLTVYWCLKRPIDPAAAIALFLLGYSALYAIPKSMALWYQKEDSLCTKKDEKKGAAASVFKVELIVLAVPAFLLFLSRLYSWNPVSAWMIVVYCVFGVIDVVATIGAIAVNKPD